jgi:hypothetical protein
MAPHLNDPKLADAREQLEKREPIFHHPEFGTTRRDFENMTDANFWEVGASGRRYSRDYVIDLLVERHAGRLDDIWEKSEFNCTLLAPDTYLATYTLVQNRTRVTRRATIWRKTKEGWKIMYHQGTVVAP